MRRIAKISGLRLIALIAGLWLAARSEAAPERSFQAATKKVEATIEPAVAKRGQTVTFRLVMVVQPGFHTYPMKQIDPDADAFITAISFNDKSATTVVVPVGAFTEPPFLRKADPVLKVKELRTIEGKAVWERQLVIRPDAEPGARKIKVKTRLQACDERGCFPGPRAFDIPLTVSDEPAVPVDPKYADEVSKAIAAATSAPTVTPPEIGPKPPDLDPTPAKTKPEPASSEASENTEEYKAGLEMVLNQLEGAAAPKSSSGLLAFVLSGIFWGAVSLITPCVFPMIPITVSFFLKQSEKQHHRPVTMALVYCATIVGVLTLAAILLLRTFRELSVNPITNFVLGGLFIYFALSLFGMYEIELPLFLTRYTSAREGQGGLAGTMFMALTFTIVSFACVAPFLGGFGGTSATSSMTWPEQIFGALAFSLTFASPFFFLAIFPTLLKKMPKSGSWLNSVKVVMGFLELAAAIGFFRTGEVTRPTPPTLFTFDVVLGLYIAICFLCGLYLLGIYRLPHDTPNEHLGVSRMLFSMAFLGLGIYLVPGMFKNAEGENQRPSGAIYAWIESFLLPDPGKGLEWEGDLHRVIAEARQRRKETGEHQLIFLDFTGKSCKNCKYNEGSVFTKADIKDELRKYRRVQLYTDVVPLELYLPRVRNQIKADPDRQKDDADVNFWFQGEAFNNRQLPLYVILDPQPGKVKVVGVYAEGKINDVIAFSEFLRQPLKEQGVAQARAGE